MAVSDLCNSTLVSNIKMTLFGPMTDHLTWFLCAVITLIVSYPAAIIVLTAVAVILYFLLIPVYITRDLPDVGFAQLRNRHMRRERNVRVLTDEISRDRDRGDVPPVYPNSWIPLLESRLLPKGHMQAVRALGQEFAVFRGKEDGKAYVMDAFCPHLGANIGFGGRVIGNCIECPFHGWQFRGEDGACTVIPYAEKVPDFIRLKKWTSLERNGFIYVWFHAEGEDPSWYPLDIPQINNGSWTFKGRTQHIVNCHIQEISENGADVAHLHQIHTAALPCGPDLSDMYDPKYSFLRHAWDPSWKPETMPGQQHLASLSLRHTTKLFGIRMPFMDVNLSIKQVGPAIVHLHFQTMFGEGVLIQCITPEAPLRQRMIHACFGAKSLPYFVSNFLLRAEDIMVCRDIMVWNNKKYVKKPVLVKEDKLIAQHRRWFSQFYSENSPTLEQELQKARDAVTNKLKYDW